MCSLTRSRGFGFWRILDISLFACALLLAHAPATAGTAEIRLSSSLMDFGPVQVGAQSDLTLTIFNDGFSQLGITGLNGLPAEGFSLVSPPTTPFQINPTPASQDITVRFAPTSPGPAETTLTVTSNDFGSPSLQVTLKGTATAAAPDIFVSTSAILFGTLGPSDTSVEPLTISNEGTTTLTVSSLTGLPSDGFALVAPPTLPFDVAAGGNRQLNVQFSPPATGSHQATLHIVSNDADESDVSVALTGTGAPGPCFISQIPVDASGLDLAGVLAAPKVKHLASGENKISVKVAISQLRMPDIATSPTAGVPAIGAAAYLLDNSDPCALTQLPQALVTVTTKAGKAGKPGRLGKTVKAKISGTTSQPTSGRFLLIVLDPANAVLETDKTNNFLVSPALL
jgi:hypothetical protein